MIENMLLMIKKRKKIGLIQVDGKMPNLALMKLSKWYKDQGHDVTLIDISNFDFDEIFASKIFVGGSGYDLKSELPPEIEAVIPDYSLYKLGHSIGFTTRGCIRNCGFCIVREKEGLLRDVPMDWIQHQKVIVMDNNFLASSKAKEKLQYFIDNKLKICFNQGLDIRLITDEIATLLSKVNYRDLKFKRKRLYFAFDDPSLETIIAEKVAMLMKHGIKPQWLLFYIIVGFNSTFEQDRRRMNIIDALGALPFIMLFNQTRDPQLRRFARWVNKRYYNICKFEDYHA